MAIIYVMFRISSISGISYSKRKPLNKEPNLTIEPSGGETPTLDQPDQHICNIRATRERGSWIHLGARAQRSKESIAV